MLLKSPAGALHGLGHKSKAHEVTGSQMTRPVVEKTCVQLLPPSVLLNIPCPVPTYTSPGTRGLTAIEYADETADPRDCHVMPASLLLKTEPPNTPFTA